METMEIDGVEGIEMENIVDILPWNESGRKWRKRRREDIDKIIVHQSLSDGKLENINNYLISPGNHISPSKGCPHICYHIVIDKEGNIKLCNDFEDITWHTKKHNRNGLSICVLGNFNGTGWNKGHNPRAVQVEALEKLLDILKVNLNLSGKDFYGHYHFGKPACPGKTLTSVIEKVRSDNVTSSNPLDTVEDIQQLLLDLGYELPVWGADGWLGEETKTAIVKFQIDTGIPVNGVADETTRNKMLTVKTERGI